ncbi:SUMO-activating enzyme subunit 2 [Orchesella cincta]|uniref:SUMO-activating enzyme subunit n=1 Tax=Orchesella cincta TaxID=48709 RepID=A0A1D2MDM3_ORCCI|nr:SUMO-activating enzyme subunit 2 [Orchesella cincta]
MASEINGLLPKDIQNLVLTSKILVVGAGGVGCELLKNLVLTGFKDIHIIDLDTIEVSNLNRQFLFRREHVGRPKSHVAKDSALKFNPNVNITAYHDSITETKYDMNFYKQFGFVMNALDNRIARSHVNRMCLASDIPLIESGSSGTLGHVTVHKKGVTECFDCTQRPHQKTFPGCTIRNTPSEPIHCIVWSKHLFNQLFGLADADEDVSPDSADPEAISDAGKAALENESEQPIARVSTRQWAQNCEYDPQKLFHKFFNDDINYLLSMDNLWKKRRPPTPLDWNNLPDAVASSSSSVSGQTPVLLKDQRVWPIAECAEVFKKTIQALKNRLENEKDGGVLIWDKDDDVAMDFVTACSNIRSFIFGIIQKSRFDTKSMAGNIIPAIASTNAIVGGFIVMTAFKVLKEDWYKCNSVYIQNRVNVRKELYHFDQVMAPNPKCYVCGEKPEIVLKIDLDRMTVRMLNEKVLKKELCIIAPDVEIEDGCGTILISSEEGEMDDIGDKLLKEFKITNGTRLRCDDFLQNYNLVINIVIMSEEESKDRDKSVECFELVGDRSQLGPKDEEPSTNGKESEKAPDAEDAKVVTDDDDDLEIIAMPMPDEDDDIKVLGTKRPLDTKDEGTPAKKRRRAEEPVSTTSGSTKYMDVEVETIYLE